MDVSCDLEVDVNGEETFMINKKTISSFCGRIRKMFGKSKRVTTRNVKVIFHDFPGGAENFELMTRFCYNHGNMVISPCNTPSLNCIAHYMEMNESVWGKPNLLERTEKSIEEIKFWSWSELLAALKQCQELPSCSKVLQKCLDSLVERFALTTETISLSCLSTSSTDSSGFRLSTDTRSTESLKNSLFRATWWFEDVVALLNPSSVNTLVNTMVLQKLDHGLISKFLIYYQKSRFVTATQDEKLEITEKVIEILSMLEPSTIPCKSLFGILRVASNLNINKCCRNSLEGMIGSQLDQATLDNILVPSPAGSSYLYDVNLVLRLVKYFLGKETCQVPLIRLKKVASLIDAYITEVAPDPRLKVFKFLALVTSLPDSARDSHDAIYNAMNIYLQMHRGLSEEEKMSICYGLNYDKLSTETCNHLTQNSKFPSRSVTLALMSQQSKLKRLLQDTNHEKPFVGSPIVSVEAEAKDGKLKEGCDQVVVYAGKLDLTDENEKLRADLQGMQWRVLELEKVCRKMHTQMSKMMKSRLSSHGSAARSLPRLCS